MLAEGKIVAIDRRNKPWSRLRQQQSLFGFDPYTLRIMKNILWVNIFLDPL